MFLCFWSQLEWAACWSYERGCVVCFVLFWIALICFDLLWLFWIDLNWFDCCWEPKQYKRANQSNQGIELWVVGVVVGVVVSYNRLVDRWLSSFRTASYHLMHRLNTQTINQPNSQKKRQRCIDNKWINSCSMRFNIIGTIHLFGNRFVSDGRACSRDDRVLNFRRCDRSDRHCTNGCHHFHGIVRHFEYQSKQPYQYQSIK